LIPIAQHLNVGFKEFIKMKRIQTGIVYKYLHPDRVDVLESGAIRFTQLNALNDPFEGYPCCSDYQPGAQKDIDKRMKQYMGTAVAQLFRAAIPLTPDYIANKIQRMLSDSFAFLSLSKKKNSLVMWAHYAESHQGFVLGFKAESKFFHPGNGKGMHGLCEVNYSSDRPMIPAGGFPSNSGSSERLNEAIFYRKSNHWEYEQELRILANPAKADITQQDGNNRPISLFRFPSESVAEVIIGLSITPEIAAKIVAIVSNKYSHANLFQAQRHDSEFGLKFVPYSGKTIE